MGGGEDHRADARGRERADLQAVLVDGIGTGSSPARVRIAWPSASPGSSTPIRVTPVAASVWARMPERLGVAARDDHARRAAADAADPAEVLGERGPEGVDAVRVAVGRGPCRASSSSPRAASAARRRAGRSRRPGRSGGSRSAAGAPPAAPRPHRAPRAPRRPRRRAAARPGAARGSPRRRAGRRRRPRCGARRRAGARGRGSTGPARPPAPCRRGSRCAAAPRSGRRASRRRRPAPPTGGALAADWSRPR